MEESQISELPDDPKVLKIMLADLLRRLHNAQHTIHSQNEALEASHKQVLLLSSFSIFLLFLRHIVINFHFERLKFMLWSSGEYVVYGNLKSFGAKLCSGEPSLRRKHFSMSKILSKPPLCTKKCVSSFSTGKPMD